MRKTHLIEEPPNTLIYKRTHTGDPNTSGTFGIENCMGQVRGWPFDAVIGVGGKSPDTGHQDISRKINWIGIGPFKEPRRGFKGLLVTFERFVLWEETGPDLNEVAPHLFKYMFVDQHVRAVKSKSKAFTPKMGEEVRKILALAETFQPKKLSRAFAKTTPTTGRC